MDIPLPERRSYYTVEPDGANPCCIDYLLMYTCTSLSVVQAVFSVILVCNFNTEIEFCKVYS